MPCYFSDGVFMNMELNYKIWVSEVNEKAVLKVLGTSRNLNFYEGHTYGRLHVKSDFTVSIFLIIKPTRCTNFSNLFWKETPHVLDSSSVHHQEFFSLYTQQCYMSYRFADSLWAGAFAPVHKLSPNLYDICHCCVYSERNSWWWTEELSETCRVSFQNKFEKLVHLVGFIIRNFSRCAVTWMSKKFSFYLLYIINVLRAVSKMLCTLIYRKVPEHNRILYCTRTRMWCVVSYC